MHDKAEAALADWLMRRCGLELSPLSIREGAEQIVTAEFDGLLADLPEEAVRAAENAIAPEMFPDELEAGEHEFYAGLAIPAFLRSLRGSTPGHREGRDDG